MLSPDNVLSKSSKLMILSPRLDNMNKILNTLEMKRDMITHTSESKEIDKTNIIKANNYDISEIKNVKHLLMNLHKSAKMNSNMHYAALKYYTKRNIRANIGLMSLSLIGSVLSPILNKIDIEIEQIIGSIMLTIVGGLGVMINRLGYQTRIEKHRQSRESFAEIVDLIEMAMAYANEENISHTYDFTHVLNEVQQIRHNLNKYTPPIPDEITNKFINSNIT